MQSEWQNLVNLFTWSLLMCFTDSDTHSFLPNSLSHTNSFVFIHLLDIYNPATTAPSAWVLTLRDSSRPGPGISRLRACTHAWPCCSKRSIYSLRQRLSKAILGAVTFQLPFCISAFLYLMKRSVVPIWFCLVLPEAMLSDMHGICSFICVRRSKSS